MSRGTVIAVWIGAWLVGLVVATAVIGTAPGSGVGALLTAAVVGGYLLTPKRGEM